MVRRSLPLPNCPMTPSGSVAMCLVMARRRLVAMRNAARCEHISPVMYTSTAATADPTAIQPQPVTWTAFSCCGAASMTSLRMRQMYHSGTSASSAPTADSAHER